MGVIAAARSSVGSRVEWSLNIRGLSYQRIVDDAAARKRKTVRPSRREVSAPVCKTGDPGALPARPLRRRRCLGTYDSYATFTQQSHILLGRAAFSAGMMSGVCCGGTYL